MAGCLATVAAAQPRQLEPGSILLYPQVDSRLGAGRGTIINVTNTNSSRIVFPNNLRGGDVRLHYNYVQGTQPWLLTDRPEYLTPNDTLTVLAGDHNPQMELGFLLIIATDIETERAVDFDYLIGSEIVVDVAGDEIWDMPAIPFRGRITGGQQSGTGHFFTDLNNNGAVDFDGSEYDYWPDKLYLDQFHQVSAIITGDLILVSLLGSDFRVSVGFLIYDNEEDVFSRTFDFICWTSVTLDQISNVFRNLGGNPNEFRSGWCRIDGSAAVNLVTGAIWRSEGGPGGYSPPIMGAFVQRMLTAPTFGAGDLLHQTGFQNGNEFPPDNVN
jgi:hypothetical protein